MVHAASGFARTRLRTQTFACTTSIGPGATNMITGAATAHINRLPVLLLPSDYYATRFQGQVLQDIEHPVSLDMSVTDCFRVVSQFFDRITRPEQILYAAPEAMRVMTDPVDAGPATIALPQDIQSVAFDCPTNFFRKKIWRIERRQPDARRIDEAIALLKDAERPYILAGGGAHYSKAWAELREFSDSFRHPGWRNAFWAGRAAGRITAADRWQRAYRHASFGQIRRRCRSRLPHRHAPGRFRHRLLFSLAAPGCPSLSASMSAARMRISWGRCPSSPMRVRLYARSYRRGPGGRRQTQCRLRRVGRR